MDDITLTARQVGSENMTMTDELTLVGGIAAMLAGFVIGTLTFAHLIMSILTERKQRFPIIVIGFFVAAVLSIGGSFLMF
jgi:hypothetical protein